MFPRPPLAFSPAGLERLPEAPWAAGPRAAIAWAAELGFRAVQLDATAPGLRPRELDRSGRRDVAALLRRHAMALTGLDLWIPPEHLADPARSERALDAILGAVELASDLGRLAGGGTAMVASLILPPDLPRDLTGAIAERSAATGVRIADHAVGVAAAPPERRADRSSTALPLPPPAIAPPEPTDVGIDPASLILAGHDPAAAAARAGLRLASARLSDATLTGRTPPMAPGAGGRLDLTAYLASIAVAGYLRPVVLDLRGLSAQGAVARAVLHAW